MWWSESQRGSSALSPCWRTDTPAPRHAFPAIRPRCCFRYLTFFGINIKAILAIWKFGDVKIWKCGSHFKIPTFQHSQTSPGSRRPARGPVVLFPADARGQALALVEPHLHADAAVGRERLREAVVDVGAQRLQRQLPVQIPLGAR